jgi:hypothetical protein
MLLGKMLLLPYLLIFVLISGRFMKKCSAADNMGAITGGMFVTKDVPFCNPDPDGPHNLRDAMAVIRSIDDEIRDYNAHWGALVASGSVQIAAFASSPACYINWAYLTFKKGKSALTSINKLLSVASKTPGVKPYARKISIPTEDFADAMWKIENSWQNKCDQTKKVAKRLYNVAALYNRQHSNGILLYCPTSTSRYSRVYLPCE